MPSKALLASSDALRMRAKRARLGIESQTLPSTCPLSRRGNASWCKDFADYRIEGIEEFPLYLGRGALLSPGAARGRRRTSCSRRRSSSSQRAASLRPSVLPGLAETGYVDSDGVLDLERIPEVGRRARRRLHRLRARTVSRAHGRDDDDADPQRTPADP